MEAVKEKKRKATVRRRSLTDPEVKAHSSDPSEITAISMTYRSERLSIPGDEIQITVHMKEMCLVEGRPAFIVWYDTPYYTSAYLAHSRRCATDEELYSVGLSPSNFSDYAVHAMRSSIDDVPHDIAVFTSITDAVIAVTNAENFHLYEDFLETLIDAPWADTPRRR